MRILIVVLFAVAAAGGGCHLIRSSPERDFFFGQSPTAVQDSIVRLPLSRQIELYVWGVTEVHPPYRLSHTIAAQGVTVVPEAIRYIDVTEDNRKRVEVVRLVRDVYCVNRVQPSTKVVEHLEAVIAEMKWSVERSEVRKALGEMKRCGLR